MSLLLHLSFDGGSSGLAAPTPVAAAYARMLANLLPPGKVWRLTPDSLLSKLFAGCADELARLDGRVTDMLDEADPRTATELLPEYESELGLESTGTDEERRARIVARLIARQRYRPADIAASLAPLLGLDAGDLVVIETSHAAAVAIGDVREIFRFFVFRDPGLGGTWFVTSAQELLDAIKPSHTAGFVIESDNALYDDPFTLYDRDILGA
jgi:hypothetical protein